jgi:hypothetical protein
MDNDFCIICKEIISTRRYAMRVKDSILNIDLKAHVCRCCFNKLLDSRENRGFFKIAGLKAWARDKKDSMRVF